MRKGKIGIFGMALVFMLAGCNMRPNKDGVSEEVKDYAAKEAESGETKDVPAHVNETIVGANGYEYVIDADVVAGGFQNAAVYEMSMPEPTDALVKQYADRLFDNSEYSVVKPYEIMNREELQEEKLFLESLIERDKNGEIQISGSIFNDASEVECYIRYNPEDTPDYTQIGELLYEQTCTFPEDGQVVTKVNIITTLRGKVDNEWWELLFCNEDGGCNRLVFRNLEFAGDACNYVTIDEMTDAMYGTNTSDRKECEATAENFIEKLGYQNMRLAHTGNIVCEETESSNNYLDGYRFVYSRNLEMQVGFSTQNMVSSKNPYETSEIYDYSMVIEPGAVQEYVWLTVSKGRIHGVQIDNIYDIGKKMSEKTTLLDFDQVMDVARETIKTEIDAYVNTGSAGYTATDIELRYVIVPYENRKYSMVPVWIFYEDLNIGYNDECFVRYGVNAIDGSIVYFLASGGGGDF